MAGFDPYANQGGPAAWDPQHDDDSRELADRLLREVDADDIDDESDASTSDDNERDDKPDNADDADNADNTDDTGADDDPHFAPHFTD